jgi:hypothetical protein
MKNITKNKISLYLFILLASIFTLATSLRVDSGDGATMYKVAESLAAGDGGSITVQPNTDGYSIGAWGKLYPISLHIGDGYGKWGRDGRYYAKYGIGLSLVLSPIVKVAKITSGYLPTLTENYAGQAAMVWFNALITAGTCALLFQVLTQFYTINLSKTLAILYGLGTFAFYYAKSAFSEPLTTFLLLLSLFAVSKRRFLLSGIALGGMLLVRQTSIFLVAPIVLWGLIIIWRGSSKESILLSTQYLIPVALAQLTVWEYNIYRFGDWMDYGYMSLRWDTPILVGLYSQLLSSGKGLFIYAPILLIGILGWPRFFRHKLWSILILVLVVFWLVPHSLYSNWEGGGGWGPRLLLPIVPLFFFSAGVIFILWRKHFTGRLALGLIIVVSISLQILGTTSNWARHLQRIYSNSSTSVQYFQRIYYNWPDSPILGQLISIKEEIALISNAESRDILQSLTAQAQVTNPSNWQTEAIGLLSINLPDYWFIYVSYLGILPLWGVLTIITGLIGTILFSICKLNKSLEPSVI